MKYNGYLIAQRSNKISLDNFNKICSKLALKSQETLDSFLNEFYWQMSFEVVWNEHLIKIGKRR